MRTNYTTAMIRMTTFSFLPIIASLYRSYVSGAQKEEDVIEMVGRYKKRTVLKIASSTYYGAEQSTALAANSVPCLALLV